MKGNPGTLWLRVKHQTTCTVSFYPMNLQEISTQIFTLTLGCLYITVLGPDIDEKTVRVRRRLRKWCFHDSKAPWIILQLTVELHYRCSYCLVILLNRQTWWHRFSKQNQEKTSTARSLNQGYLEIISGKSYGQMWIWKLGSGERRRDCHLWKE